MRQDAKTNPTFLTFILKELVIAKQNPTIRKGTRRALNAKPKQTQKTFSS